MMMSRTHVGLDGTYSITSDRSIDHHRKDGTTCHYTGVWQIPSTIDRMDVERLFKEEREKEERANDIFPIAPM